MIFLWRFYNRSDENNKMLIHYNNRYSNTTTYQGRKYFNFLSQIKIRIIKRKIFATKYEINVN